MKVMLVAPYFEPAVGGVENYLLQIVRRLSHDWEVLVVTAGLDGTASERVDGQYGYRVVSLPVDTRLFNTPLCWSWAHRLSTLIREEHPDVVNAHMPVPGLADVAARVHGDVPFVLTYHNDVVKSGSAAAVARAYNLLVGRGTLRRSRRVICTSAQYVDQSPYLDAGRLVIDLVPPGVDADRLTPSDDPGGVSEPVVLFVANLDLTHFHKGLDVLLKAMEVVVGRVPDARLVVVGKGDGESEYRHQADALGLSERVDFRGFVGDDELPAVYRSARVTVLPSTNAAEGFGMVLLESQACGTPVIGSRVGGIPAALDEGSSGLLVEPGSVEQLADALTGVLGSDAVYRELRSGCRPYAERFTWDEAARRTDAAYRQAIGAEVVQVSALYPPALGGLEQVCATFSEGLAARGWAVRVITSILPDPPATAAVTTPGTTPPPGPHTRATSGGAISGGQPTVTRLRAFDIGGMPVLPALYPALRRLSRPAVIHVHLSQAGIPELAVLAARRRRIPIVIHFHLDVAPSGRFGAVFSLYKRHVLPRTLRAASRVVCFSAEQRDFLVDTYGVDRERVRIVENGITPMDTARRERTFDGPLEVLFVGRLAPQKRVDVLLEALALLRHDDRLSARIVGSGPLEEELKRRADELGLAHIEFTGRLDGDDLADAYREADLFVLPSEREGMPLVLLEAMSAGLAVVASDAPGIRDFVSPGKTGLLFATGSPEALAEVLAGAMADQGGARRMATAGQQYAAELTWDRALERTEAVLREVL